MKFVTIVVAMIFAFGAATAASAQGRGNGQAKKTTQAKPAKTQTRAVKAEARTAKATAKAETRAARATTKAETRTAKAATKTARTETGAPKTTNPKQEARLVAMLPPGTNIQDAALGFKNRGQFIAAVNASNNHGIPFADLKAKMTGIAPGTTEPTMPPMSLGQALQSFKVTPPPAPLP
jgi:hypothetical protein